MRLVKIEQTTNYPRASAFVVAEERGSGVKTSLLVLGVDGRGIYGAYRRVRGSGTPYPDATWFHFGDYTFTEVTEDGKTITYDGEVKLNVEVGDLVLTVTDHMIRVVEVGEDYVSGPFAHLNKTTVFSSSADRGLFRLSSYDGLYKVVKEEKA